MLRFSPFRRLIRSLAFLAAVAAGPPALDAMFIMPEIRMVPVDRLVSNLEAQIRQEPGSVELHLNLARLHAMAYALKSSDAQVRGRDELWFGSPHPKLIPYQVKPAASAEDAAIATLHLRSAASEYDAVLELDSSNLPGRLGHGWILEQGGHRSEAIAEYRGVIERAWPKESTSTRTDVSTRYYTDEAVDYLVPLLDPAKDAAEIETLRARQKKLRSLPRAVTPLALWLSHDPARACDAPLAPDARVRFDADGSGVRQPWTWIAPDAAWLVHDSAHTGAIASALQLFGNVTFWLFWENGYHALGALDDNRDGELRGEELAGLAVWQDLNTNGVGEPRELRPLAAVDIVALSVLGEISEEPDVAAWARRGVQFRDGRWESTWDVVLHNAASTSTPITASTESATKVHDVMRLIPSSTSSGYAWPSCGDIR